MSQNIVKKQAKEFLRDLNLVRGSVGRSDLVSIGQGVLKGSDGVWCTVIEDESYQTDEVISLSYMKLLEVVRACDMGEFVLLIPKKAKCVVKSKGAGWVLNIRSDVVPLIEGIEGESKKASVPSMLDAFISLKHLVKLDLSRPGLMFGNVSNQNLAIGDGARLGIIECYCSSTDFPLVVLQELARMLKETAEQDLEWVENSEYFDFSVGRVRFVARKLEGGFEKEWRDEIEREIQAPIATMMAPKSSILSAVNQTLVVSEDAVNLRVEDDFLIIAAEGEGGEKAVSKVGIMEFIGTVNNVIMSGLDLRDAIQAKRDPSIYISVCEKYVVITDTQGKEVLCRRVV